MNDMNTDAGQAGADRRDAVTMRFAQAAARYLEQESNRQSLITVTRAEISRDGRDATIFITVLPETAEASVMSFARRNRTELREFIKKEVPVARIPTFDVAIDLGEKHRQRIDTLLDESQ